MKRRTYRAVVTTDAGNTIVGERETFAWNSAVRATEAILRDYGRESVGPLHGGRPQITGERNDPARIYRRTWTTATGRECSAMVWEVID